jgi:hypothetical protein
MNIRMLSIIPLLSLVSCASNDRAYTGYQNADRSVVLGDLYSPSKVHVFINEVPVSLERIDGMGIAPGADNSQMPLAEIEVSPGHHRLSIGLEFPPQHYQTKFDLNCAANHVVRLTGKESPYGIWVQVWDETDGFGKRKLLREVEIASVTPDRPGVLQLNPQEHTMH